MTSNSSTNALFRVQNVTKRFGGVLALDNVSFEVLGGEVHGLVGQNGSGKSTLVKIISGYHAPEPGSSVWLRGETLDLPIRGPHQRGIAVIHQDLGLVDTMSIAENIGVGSRFGVRGPSPISWKRERKLARDLLQGLGIDFDPEWSVGKLSPAGKAMIGIARAMRQLQEYGHPDVLLILDEPTVYLTKSDVELLTNVLQSLIRRYGAGVIFISHRLREVQAICDRVTVLRDGRVVSTLSSQSGSEEEISRLMIGRSIGNLFPDKSPPSKGEILLSVDGLCGEVVRDVSFTLRAGELLGVTGLEGMGQLELPKLVIGAERSPRGRVSIQGRDIQLSPRRALAQGVAMLSADRVRHGGWMDGTALENISLPVIRRYAKRFGFDHVGERSDALDLMHSFAVRPPKPDQLVRAFSGGNQQKIILAKWLQIAPKVLLLNEPTQGVDAEGKKEILEIIRQTAERGAGIVVFSSDYEQIAHLCHRVIVLSDGRIVAELIGPDVTEGRIASECHAA